MNIKKIIGGLILLIIVSVGFIQLDARADSESLLVSEGNLNAVDSDLLPILLELRSIKLDGSVLEDKAFLNLKDFSTKIKEQPVGRSNPFSKIGVDKVFFEKIDDKGILE